MLNADKRSRAIIFVQGVKSVKGRLLGQNIHDLNEAKMQVGVGGLVAWTRNCELRVEAEEIWLEASDRQLTS